MRAFLPVRIVAAASVALLVSAMPTSAFAASYVVVEPRCTSSTGNEIVIASQTTGATYHSDSSGSRWYKGVKANQGATTYTGRAAVGHVSVDAPSIASAGYRCA